MLAAIPVTNAGRASLTMHMTGSYELSWRSDPKVYFWTFLSHEQIHFPFRLRLMYVEFLLLILERSLILLAASPGSYKNSCFRHHRRPVGKLKCIYTSQQQPGLARQHFRKTESCLHFWWHLWSPNPRWRKLSAWMGPSYYLVLAQLYPAYKHYLMEQMVSPKWPLTNCLHHSWGVHESGHIQGGPWSQRLRTSPSLSLSFLT